MVDLDVISQRRQMSGWWTRSQRLTGELCGWREMGGGSQDVQRPASGGIGIGKKKSKKGKGEDEEKGRN